MGKATGWLRGLLGGKKKTGSEGKERKGWGLVKSLRDGGSRKTDRNKAWESPRCNACGSSPAVGKGGVGDVEEQSKRAIAVATATAAAAEAAVAAAQAAAAVVKLTSSCGGGTASWSSNEWAAVKIQSAFRGYLARKALKALKGLVKIQALVRGHIVRKQAAETLRCMHALVRAQARARAGRAIDPRSGKKGSRRHSLEPLTSERNGARHPTSSKKKSSGLRNVDTIEPKAQHSWGSNRVEDRYWDSRESVSRNSKTTDEEVEEEEEEEEEDEKILEIDAGRPHGSNPRWRSIRHSTCDPTNRKMPPDTPSKDYTVVQDSMLLSPSSSVKMQPSLSSLMFPLEGVECTTESPMFYSATSRSRRGSFAPSKSSFFGGYADHPNYMANTESSRAKVRSQSAPRQRPEFDKSTGYASQVQSGGGGGSGSSSQRSLHLKFAGRAYPGSGRLDRMGMPLRM